MNKPSSEQNWWVVFTGQVGDDYYKFTGTIYPPLDEGEEIHCICGQPNKQHDSYPILNTRRGFQYNRKTFINFILRLKVPQRGKTRLNRLLDYCGTPKRVIPIILSRPDMFAQITGTSFKTAVQISEDFQAIWTENEILIELCRWGVPFSAAKEVSEEMQDNNVSYEDFHAAFYGNPYRVLREASSLPFPDIDKIALALPFADKHNMFRSFPRIEAALEYEQARQLNAIGGTAVNEYLLIQNTAIYLNKTAQLFGYPALDHATFQQIVASKLEKTREYIDIPGYPPTFAGLKPYNPKTDSYASNREQKEKAINFAMKDYNCEVQITKRIVDILSTKHKNISIQESDLALHSNSKFAFDSEQKQFLLHCLSEPITILTGGPGTGKTRTLNELALFCQRHGLHLAAAAPTGKAAKRLQYSIPDDIAQVKTIHRLLECTFTDTKPPHFSYNRNHKNPLHCNVLIIDEMSMVSNSLFLHILDAVPDTAFIILVGDADQLPPIENGKPFLDLIKSRKIATYRLRTNHRTTPSGRLISQNAANILLEKPLEYNSSSFQLIQSNNEQEIIEISYDLYQDYLNKNPNLAPDQDKIQIITPYHRLQKGKHLVSVEGINAKFQNEIIAQNPGIFMPKPKIFTEDPEKEPEIPSITLSNSKTFLKGDRVIQCKNRYVKKETKDSFFDPFPQPYDLYNGDIGYIVSIQKKRSKMQINKRGDCMPVTYTYFTLHFPEKPLNFEYPVCYDYFDDISRKTIRKIMPDFALQLAYAIPVHKSQGDEYDEIIFPVFGLSSFYTNTFATKNLLYTAITRAKDKVVIVGDPEAIDFMLHNTTPDQRITGLALQLNKKKNTQTGCVFYEDPVTHQAYKNPNE